MKMKLCFNPCFNGTMYKNTKIEGSTKNLKTVSILVLMELCIKTKVINNFEKRLAMFQSLF